MVGPGDRLLLSVCTCADPGAPALVCVAVQCINHVRLAEICRRVCRLVAHAQCVLWLSDYLLAHPDLVDGAVVLELGAGVGLTGVILAGPAGASLHPSGLVLTDGLDAALTNIRANLPAPPCPDLSSFQAALAAPTSPTAAPSPVGSRCEGAFPTLVLPLIWGQFSPSLIRDLPPVNLVLAADILFDENDFDAVFATFVFFLTRTPHTDTGSSMSPTRVLTCHHRRGASTRLTPFLRRWQLELVPVEFASTAPARATPQASHDLELMWVQLK